MSTKSSIEDENAENIKNLERMIHMKENNEIRLEEERNQYEMMVFEQQKIIRLALARIVPNKNIRTKTQFCQVHLHLFKFLYIFFAYLYLGAPIRDQRIREKVLQIMN